MFRRSALPLLILLAACGSPRGTGDSTRLDSGMPGTDAGPGRDSGPAVDSGPRADGGAPETFQVEFTTSKGTFVVEAHRSWAPHGTDRFYELVTSGYYDQDRFFRVVPGFMVQFGINGTPATTAMWSSATIPDDPVVQSNTPGYVSFAAQPAPNTRTTQLFINYGNNAFLDTMRFAPFGLVISGMDVVNMINAEYGEMPSQMQITDVGNSYLMSSFPNLDYILTARVL